MSMKRIPTEHSMDLLNESPSQHGNKYEVFMSFNTDADISFPSRLYSSLRQAGISVLKCDIAIELLESIIEGCKISIIIFSEHYASSRRCLVELAKLMEFRKAHDQAVLPIFYGLFPSAVRNQEYRFGEAFQGLVQRISPTEHQVSRWRTALNEAGGIPGFAVSARYPMCM